jgi:hypothetical protein
MVAINLRVTRPTNLGMPPEVTEYHIHIFQGGDSKPLAADLPPNFVTANTTEDERSPTPNTDDLLKKSAAIIERGQANWSHMFTNQASNTATISLVYDPANNNTDMWKNSLTPSDTTKYWISVRAVNDFGSGDWMTSEQAIQYLPSGEFQGVEPNRTDVPEVTVHNWRATHMGVPGACYPSTWATERGPIGADPLFYEDNQKLHQCLDACDANEECGGVYFKPDIPFPSNAESVTIPEIAMGSCFPYKFGSASALIPNIFDNAAEADGACFVSYTNLENVGNGTMSMVTRGIDTHLIRGKFLNVYSLYYTKPDGVVTLEAFPLKRASATGINDYLIQRHDAEDALEVRKWEAKEVAGNGDKVYLVEDISMDYLLGTIVRPNKADHHGQSNVEYDTTFTGQGPSPAHEWGITFLRNDDGSFKMVEGYPGLRTVNFFVDIAGRRRYLCYDARLGGPPPARPQNVTLVPNEETDSHPRPFIVNAEVAKENISYHFGISVLVKTDTGFIDDETLQTF